MPRLLPALIVVLALAPLASAQPLLACSYEDGGSGSSGSGDIAVCGPCLFLNEIGLGPVYRVLAGAPVAGGSCVTAFDAP